MSNNKKLSLNDIFLSILYLKSNFYIYLCTEELQTRNKMRRFNILCTLLIVFIIAGTCFDIYHSFPSFRQGFKDGGSINYCNDGSNSPQVSTGITTLVELQSKDDAFNFHIRNNKTGETEAFQPQQIRIRTNMDSDAFDSFGVLGGCTAFVCIVSLLMMLYGLVRVVLLVRKGQYFTTQVEKYLKLIGCGGIMIWIGQLALAVTTYYMCNAMFELEGFKVVVYDLLPTSFNMYLGLGMLIIAQIFAMARKMKEEQDLTV